MTETVVMLSDVSVTLIDLAGTDQAIADAARVSLLKPGEEVDRSRDAGLINTLLKKSHGTPFEHTFLKFHVEAPIYTFREFMRHRIGFSYNEMSARYTEMLPRFYAPAAERPLVNAGTSMNPNYIAGNQEQISLTHSILERQAHSQWNDYQLLLANGVAKEIARSVLGVDIMSQMIVSCNARSLMSFIKLRVDDPDNTYETKPQYEIQLVARKMEAIFAHAFPLTYESFIKNGRVAP